MLLEVNALLEQVGWWEPKTHETWYWLRNMKTVFLVFTG